MQPASRPAELLSKVPPITLAFWAVKILATTVGETGGDALSMSLHLGYAVSSLIFLCFFCLTAAIQVRADRYHPLTYWAVVVATTTVGTTMSDYLDRTLGLGYVKSSLLLFGAVIVVLLLWRRTTGTIAADHITTRPNEIFYWLTILVSNTLGTALGDFIATDAGLGFQRGALVFGGLIALVAAVHVFLPRAPEAVLFWAAYVLTRPLGATLGDTLTKPHAEGGLDFSRITSSLVLAGAMVVIVASTSLGRRARAKSSESSSSSWPNCVGRCEHCGCSFGYVLCHNGFNDSAYAYCDKCGRTAIISGWHLPPGVHIPMYQPVPVGSEGFMQPCECGGRYRGDASPRCPSCQQPLSAVVAAKWIEAQAPGTKKGWRWQRTWQGVYCIVINGRTAGESLLKKA